MARLTSKIAILSNLAATGTPAVFETSAFGTSTGMSPDVEFYKRHYKGGIEIDSAQEDSSAADALRPGGRYCLVADRFRSNAKPTDFVVELGCGNGHTLMLLARKHALPRVVGIDVAFKHPQTVDGVEFRNHNLNDRWPFDDGSINHLIAMMVFEHLFDPFHCFDEVRRTLAPGATAYVNLPLVTGIRNRLRLLAGHLPVTSIGVDRWFDERGWDGNHLHYFSLDAIRRLATASGLRVVDVRGVGSFHALKTMLPTLLANEITFSLRHV